MTFWPPPYEETQRRFRIQNKSGVAMPSFACFRISGSEKQADGEIVRYAVQPDGADGIYAFSGAMPIENEKHGYGSISWPVVALYTSGTPTVGSEWGPVSGSWHIQSSGEGFKIFSEPDTEHTLVEVESIGGRATNLVRFELTSEKPAGHNTATDNAETVEWNGSSYAKTGTAIKVVDGHIEWPKVQSGRRGWCQQPSDRSGVYEIVFIDAFQSTLMQTDWRVLGRYVQGLEFIVDIWRDHDSESSWENKHLTDDCETLEEQL